MAEFGVDQDLFGLNDPLGAFYEGMGFVEDPYPLDENGNRVNQDGERVYAWLPPNELGGAAPIATQFTQYFTEDEIRDAWDAEEGMGYFKEAFGGSFEDYMAFLTERQGLIDSGEMDPSVGVSQEWMLQFVADNGRQPTQEEINAAGTPMWNTPEHDALLEKYGIPKTWYNDDGDKFEFNGGSFTKTEKQDQFGLMDLGRLAMTMAVTAGMGGPLTGALQAAGMSSATAAAASAAIINSAVQMAATGELDFKQALLAAATAGIKEYLPTMTGNIEGAAGDLINSITEYVDKAQGYLDSNITNEFLNAAVKAGLSDIAMQAITSGDVDFEQALLAGGTAAAMKYLQFKFGDQMTPEQQDDFEAWLNEQEAMDAQFPNNDPFGEWTEVNGQTLYLSEGDYYNADGTKATLEQIGVTETPEVIQQYPPETGGALTYRQSGTYYDAEGNVVDSVRYSTEQDQYVDAITGEPVFAVTEGIYDSNGNLRYYQEEGTWYEMDENNQATAVDDPRLVASLVDLSKGGVAGDVNAVTVYDQDGNILGTRPQFTDEDYRGYIAGAPNDPSAIQDVYFDGEYYYVYKPADGVVVRYTELPEELDQQVVKTETTEQKQADVEVETPGGKGPTEDVGGSVGGGPAGAADATSNTPTQEAYINAVNAGDTATAQAIAAYLTSTGQTVPEVVATTGDVPADTAVSQEEQVAEQTAQQEELVDPNASTVDEAVVEETTTDGGGGTNDGTESAQAGDATAGAKDYTGGGGAVGAVAAAAAGMAAGVGGETGGGTDGEVGGGTGPGSGGEGGEGTGGDGEGDGAGKGGKGMFDFTPYQYQPVYEPLQLQPIRPAAFVDYVAQLQQQAAMANKNSNTALNGMLTRLLEEPA